MFTVATFTPKCTNRRPKYLCCWVHILLTYFVCLHNEKMTGEVNSIVHGGRKYQSKWTCEIY